MPTETFAGRVDPAFQVAHWESAGLPFIIFHHGNNERPFDYSLTSKNTFKNVLYKQKDFDDTCLVSLRAPFHNSLKEYQQRMEHLTHFVGMLAVSVRLVEKLVEFAREQGYLPVVVTGISLGGWVTNLHRAYYNSADAYIPMLAGASLAEVFLSSAYRKVTGDLALENPRVLREALNFERKFIKVPDKNVFPLLAVHDQIIEYNIQRRAYENHIIEELQKGHLTASLDFQALRQHVISNIHRTEMEDRLRGMKLTSPR
ncbi:MAG: alpha/beta hydrolase family protein [Anaerolineales bacterium]